MGQREEEVAAMAMAAHFCGVVLLN